MSNNKEEPFWDIPLHGQGPNTGAAERDFTHFIHAQAEGGGGQKEGLSERRMSNNKEEPFWDIPLHGQGPKTGAAERDFTHFIHAQAEGGGGQKEGLSERRVSNTKDEPWDVPLHGQGPKTGAAEMDFTPFIHMQAEGGGGRKEDCNPAERETQDEGTLQDHETAIAQRLWSLGDNIHRQDETSLEYRPTGQELRSISELLNVQRSSFQRTDLGDNRPIKTVAKDVLNYFREEEQPQGTWLSTYGRVGFVLLYIIYQRWKSQYTEGVGVGFGDVISNIAWHETSPETLTAVLLARLVHDFPLRLVGGFISSWFNTLLGRGQQVNRRADLKAEEAPVYVPPTSSPYAGDIEYNFLTKMPADLVLQENEALISCGIRFSPSGRKLKEPYKVTLDHNAHFSNPTRAEIVFYTRRKGSDRFERIRSSATGYPRCVVRARDLDVYVDHFSDWWIVALIKQYFVGKKVICVPYIYPPVTFGCNHDILLWVYDDLTEIIKKVNNEMTAYQKLFPAQQMFIEWWKGDIIIELFEGQRGEEQKIGEKRMDERQVSRVDRKLFYFDVESCKLEERQKFMRFTLNQETVRCDQTLIRFILTYVDKRIAYTHTKYVTGQELANPIPEEIQEKTLPKKAMDSLELDKILNRISQKMPFGHYTEFCLNLGMSYGETKATLAKYQCDYQQATMDCLSKWKTRTVGDIDELRDILDKTEIGGWARTCVPQLYL